MRDNQNFYMDYEDRSFGGPSPNDYQDGIFSGQFNFGQPPVPPVQPIVQPVQQIQPVQPIVQPIVEPVQPIQPVQPPSPTDNLLKQILGQGTTNWSGVGYGSAEANAADMAKILAGIGITDINQFGRITRPVEEYVGTEYEGGPPVYQTRMEETFGNKLTGQAVPLTYGGRQSGNFFGGTYEGKGNTGYGVYFDEQGNPRFYTQGASSSDIGKLAPLLTMASFVPGLAPVAQGINALLAAKFGNILGAISGAAGLGGLTDIANAANFAGALKSGNPLAAITTGANLGGIDLGGLVDASGIKDFTRIGDYDITDVVKAAQTAKAIKSGDPSAIISAIGGYMGGRDEQPSEPSPAEPYEEPITGSSRFANREAPDPFASVGTEPVPSIEMPDLGSTFPSFISEPSKANQSFNSAFADARARGQSVFEWNGKPYTTELAPPKQPTYDSVGGGRGGQGGATAEELAAYNQRNQFGGYDDILESRAGSFNWGKRPKELPGPYAPIPGTFMKATPDQLERFTPYPDTGVMRQQNVLNPMIPSSSTGSDYLTKFINVAENSGYMNPDWGLYKPGVQLLSGSTWDPSKGSGAWVPQRQYAGTRGSIFMNDQTPYTGSEAANLLSHELVHVNQNLDTLYNSLTRRGQKEFDKNLYSVLPYLKEKYGYFGGYDDNPNAPLAERMADLQGFQFNNKIDLAKDPVFQKLGLGNDPDFNAIWNASTIERSTRLDPRDLPPGKITESDYPKGKAPLYYRPIDRLTDYVSKKVKNTIGGGKAEGGLASLKRSNRR